MRIFYVPFPIRRYRSHPQNFCHVLNSLKNFVAISPTHSFPFSASCTRKSDLPCTPTLLSPLCSFFGGLYPSIVRAFASNSGTHTSRISFAFARPSNFLSFLDFSRGAAPPLENECPVPVVAGSGRGAIGRACCPCGGCPNPNGGCTNGGCTNGGCTNGGCTNGGCPNPNGGCTNDGCTNDGCTNPNGGCTNGGCTNDGCTNGGCTNDGCTNGGCTNGGCPNGGCPNGGCPNPNGGCTNGGCTDGACTQAWDAKFAHNQQPIEMEMEIIIRAMHTCCCGCTGCPEDTV